MPTTLNQPRRRDQQVTRLNVAAPPRVHESIHPASASMARQSTTRTQSKMPVVFDTRVVTGSGGGPDKTILNSPRFFEQLGYRMVCGYLTPPGDPGYQVIIEKAAKYNAELITIADRGAWDLSVFTQLLAVCRKERVSIWHGHDYKTNVLGLMLRPFHPMHLVSTVHGWVHHTSKTPLYYQLDKLSLRRHAKVYCVSYDLYNECRKFGVHPNRLELLENAIDIHEYQRRKSLSEAKLACGFQATDTIFGAVGRLEPEKGFDILIQAFAEIAKAQPHVKLMIIGDGAQRDYLRKLIEQLTLKNQVVLTGWQAEVKPYFEAMDFFNLSSLREGLPNVVLEAMAMGVPVIATRVAGLPKLINHGHDGLLIDPGSRDQLKNAMHQLLSSPLMAARLAQAARSKIESKYDFAARIARMSETYNTLLRGKS